jgi:hypothetical protein
MSRKNPPRPFDQAAMELRRIVLQSDFITSTVIGLREESLFGRVSILPLRDQPKTKGVSHGSPLPGIQLRLNGFNARSVLSEKLARKQSSAH